MVAIFKTADRNDAKGVKGEFDGTVNSNEKSNRKLTRIDLYTKAEIKAKGISNAKPLKTVQFFYTDSLKSLCPGTPDNRYGHGKLTLDSIKFSYNGQTRQKKDLYVFNYGNMASSADNPSYAYNASDRWGTYKSSTNPYSLTNIEYPYTDTSKTKNDQAVAAWSLRKILLPSGGQLEVQYEADDYAYVQNRRACNMFNVFGIGNSSEYLNDSALYKGGASAGDNYYVYIKLPAPLVSTGTDNIKAEIYSKYLEGINQIAFKLMINMPKGLEPLTVYANYNDYGLCSGIGSSKDIIYIKLSSVDSKSPLTKSVLGFLIENLPGQAFSGYDVEVSSVSDFLDLAGDMLRGIKDQFKNAENQMKADGKARYITLVNSFIRLNNPWKMKYGGGIRVKRILVKDNWKKMTGNAEYNSIYGQDYDYTTTEKINNKDTVISSGVASYEPGIGSEENPFREILTYSNKMPLASAQYGAIEMPMLESFYPSPNVGYSKVTVRSIHRKGTHGDSSLRSAIGKQVTEFYTAREYPSYSSFTPMDSREFHRNSIGNILYKDITDRRTISQGFLIETNDMHGKMKSQIAYSASDEKTPLSYSYHSYKNTGQNGLNDTVDFVYNAENGAVHSGNIGIDVELMTDVREFRMQSNGFNGQIQTDFFSFVPFPIFVIPMLPLKTYQENKYRAVTCTKLINYHAIEDSVIMMDKGSVVSTKTIAYDSETGSALVTKTANEFNDPVYNVIFPAYWAYTGAGLAYKNIDRQFSSVNFSDGKMESGVNVDTTVFESGDEIFITKLGTGSPSCIPASADVTKLWAVDKHKYGINVGIPVDGEDTLSKSLIFIDKDGKLFTRNAVSFRIVRSGRRNNLGLTVADATTMGNPIREYGTVDTLRIDRFSLAVSASAIEYKDKWQTDNDVFKRYKLDTTSCVVTEVEDCTGYLEKNINPYLKGLIGNFKPYRSYTYYGNRSESDPDAVTAIRKNGYISSFKSYWNFDDEGSLVPDHTSTKWVWNSEQTKVNMKGQELETKDALNHYTAAQYGFNKTMPVATMQNSHYGQAFNEGFEDYGYCETINKMFLNNCARKYIDFTGLSQSNILNTDSLGFAAHSGRYVLSVDSLVEKTMEIQNSEPDSFSIILRKDTIIGLNYIGGVITKTASIPSNAPMSHTVTFDSLSMLLLTESTAIPDYDNNNVSYTYVTEQYADITSSQNYTFHFSGTASCTPLHGTCTSALYTLNFYIKNLDGEIIGSHTISSASPTPNEYTIYLCSGIYKVECSCVSFFATNDDHQLNSSFNYYCTNDHPVGYSSLYPAVKCTFTRPVPAVNEMLNPIFHLVPGKRMQFSAWVREECGNATNTPCYKINYDSTHIELRFTGGSSVTVNIKPSGAIIEGWQKIEGEFTSPSDATSAKLVFRNDGYKDAYFDDIRIHPFNANMKSYVYDPGTARLLAELDENNYATFYEYDEEGQLVRVKKETILGIKTVNETRSAKQKTITDVQ